MDNVAGPLTPASCMVREGQEYPQWIKDNSSQKVATVGSVPYKFGEPWWHHNCSSKWHKRIWCLLEEEWWDLGDVSRSTLSKGSPEPAPQDEEGKGANLKGHPPGPILLMEPAIATVISTSMGRDQRTGAVYVSTMTAYMEIMNLEAPQWW